METYRDMLDSLLDLDCGLTQWEVDFLESLSEWEGDFTEKQAETLQRIYDRRM